MNLDTINEYIHSFIYIIGIGALTGITIYGVFFKDFAASTVSLASCLFLGTIVYLSAKFVEALITNGKEKKD